MILVLIPLAFIALLYGFWRLYVWLALVANAAVGAVTVTVLAAILIAICARIWLRHRSLHGKTVNGRRVLVLEGAWGRLAVNARDKRGNLTLQGKHVDFIFGDIANAAGATSGDGPAVALALGGGAPSTWTIPMPSKHEAARWQRILTLAQERRL